jgi:NADH-quinone oxidoreductase subunit N
VAFLALISMFVGSIAAIGQRDIKRLMAYSSISHMGFALMGLAAGTAFGVQAMLIYMAIYCRHEPRHLRLHPVDGAERRARDRHPVAQHVFARGAAEALAMLVLMFSMAGVPPMIGFFGKFYVLRAAYEGGSCGSRWRG